MGTSATLVEAQVEVELGQLRIRNKYYGDGSHGEIRTCIRSITAAPLWELDFVLSTTDYKACETIKIKGSSEQLVNAIMGSNPRSCIEFIEPTGGSNKHVLVARNLVKTSKTVAVRAANTAPAGITVRKEDFLAAYSPMIETNTFEAQPTSTRDTLVRRK